MNMFVQNLALLLALAAVMPLTVQAFRVDSKLSLAQIPVTPTSSTTPCLSSPTLSIIEDLRAGAVDSDDEYDDEYDSDVDEEEEDEEEEVAAKLSASTIAAIKKAEEKAAMKKKQEIKKKVATSLSSSSASSSSPKKKKKKISSIASKIPYPIRAFMNPFTCIAMLKGYFASLFNIDYLQKVRTMLGLTWCQNFCCVHTE